MVDANQGKKCSKDRLQLEAFPLITTITTIITTITCTKVSKVKKTNKVTMTEVIKVTARLTAPVTTTPQAIPCATKTVIATRAMYTPPELPQVGGVCGIIPEATPVKTIPVKGQ